MAADSALQDDGPVGPRLHRDVPPECWCVTRQDLRDLRREVQEAVREGRVVPTARDQFDPADNAVGPNFYTVVEQYIKAVTAKSQASWALQRHPEGLRCDTFVTHAWAEGIYEFIDKVLASWPRGAKHAWICTLSMPQHLNISELIRSPRESPFAKALDSATQVLAVPNQICSIYTRLWCVYEAFLAQQQGKLIYTAVKPHVRSTIRVLVWVLSGIVVGLVAGVAVAPERRSRVTEADAVMILFPLAALATELVQDSLLRALVNTSSSAMVSFVMTGAPLGFLRIYGCFILFFVIAEVDRGRLAAYEEEVSNLNRDFDGSVLAAKCTDLADKTAIWGDIGDAAEDVDHAILVLMRARMSTPLCSRLARDGFKINDAAFMEWAFFALCLLFLIGHFLKAASSGSPVRIMFIALTILELAVVGLLNADRRSFALRAVEKAVLARVLITVVLYFIAVSGAFGGLDRETRRFIMFKTDGILVLMCLLVASTPPLLLARIPCVGGVLVQLVLLRYRVRLFEGRSPSSFLRRWREPIGPRSKRPASAETASPS